MDIGHVEYLKCNELMIAELLMKCHCECGVGMHPLLTFIYLRREMLNIMRRIVADKPIQELSAEGNENAFQELLPKWIKEFEDNGFLEATKLESIKDEDEFVQKLQEHKDDLMIIKYWKHGCIPCLSVAEMVKEAEAKSKSNGKKVFWYSVDTHSSLAKNLVNYQLISGTPTIQTFTGLRQVGQEIRPSSTDELLTEVYKRTPTLTT